MLGLVAGQVWFFFAPINGFAAQKLLAATGERPFSGVTWRLFKNVATPHMLWGGATVLTYQLVIDFMTHHNHTSNRPAFIDHTLAMTILGTAAGAMTGKGGPTRMFTGAFFALTTLAPLTWWVKMQGLLPGS